MDVDDRKPTQAYKEFLSYCADSLDQDGPKIMKILEMKYKSCSKEKCSSIEMVDLLERTMRNMKKEPNRAFVHLKDLVSQLKIWSKAKRTKKASIPPPCETNVDIQEQNKKEVSLKSEIKMDQDRTERVRAVEEREDFPPSPSDLGLRAPSPPHKSPIKSECKVVLFKSEFIESQVEAVACQSMPSPSKCHMVSIVDGNFNEARVITKASRLQTTTDDEGETSIPGPSRSFEQLPHERLMCSRSLSESCSSSKIQSTSISAMNPNSSRKSSVDYTLNDEIPLKSTIILEVNSSSPKIQHIQSVSHSKQNTIKPTHCKALQFKTHCLPSTSNKLFEPGTSENKHRDSKDEFWGVLENVPKTPMKPISSEIEAAETGNNMHDEKEAGVENEIMLMKQFREERSSSETECFRVSSYLEQTTAFLKICKRRSSSESSTSSVDPSDEQPQTDRLMWKEVVTFGPVSCKSPSVHSEVNKIDSLDLTENSPSFAVSTSSKQSEIDPTEQVVSLGKSDPEGEILSLPQTYNVKSDSDTASMGRSRLSSIDTIVIEEPVSASNPDDPPATECSKVDATQPENKAEGVITVNNSVSSNHEDTIYDKSNTSISKSAESSLSGPNQKNVQGFLKEDKDKHASLSETKPDVLKKDNVEEEKVMISSVRSLLADNVEGETDSVTTKLPGDDNKNLPNIVDMDDGDSDNVKGLSLKNPDKLSSCVPDAALCEDSEVDENKEESTRPIQIAEKDLILKPSVKLVKGNDLTVKKQPRRALLIPYIVKADDSVIARKLREANINKDNTKLKSFSCQSTTLNKDNDGGHSSGDEFVSKERKVPQQNLSPEEEKRQRHIKKLEKLLESLRDEIEKCQAQDMSLDDLGAEDSSYIYEDKLKNKFVKVWEKLCEVTKRTVETGRPTERTIKFSSTRYKEINRRLEKFLNKTKCFPDIHDVKRIIKMTNTKYKLGLTPLMIPNIAREAFVDIGEMLQSRRHEDFIASFGTRQTDMLRMGSGGMDPYWTDSLLRRKLDSNRQTARSNLDQVIAKYSRLQETKGKEDSDDEDEEEDDDDDGKSHAKTSVHRKTKQKGTSNSSRRDKIRKIYSSESEKDDLDDDGRDNDDDEETSELSLSCGRKYRDDLKKLGATKTTADRILGPSHYLTSSRKQHAGEASTSSYMYDDTEKLGLSKAPVPIDVDQKSDYLESVGLLSLPVNPYLHKAQKSPTRSPAASTTHRKTSFSLPSSPASVIQIEDSPAKPSNSKLSVLSIDKKTDEKSTSDIKSLQLGCEDGQPPLSKLGAESASAKKAPTLDNSNFEAVEDIEDQTSDSDSDGKSDNDDGDDDYEDDDIVTIMSSPRSVGDSDSELSRGPSPVSVSSLSSDDDEVPNTAAVETQRNPKQTTEMNDVGGYEDKLSEKTRMMAALNLMSVPGREQVEVDEDANTTVFKSGVGEEAKSAMFKSRVKNNSVVDNVTDVAEVSHKSAKPLPIKDGGVKIAEEKCALRGTQKTNKSSHEAIVEDANFTPGMSSARPDSEKNQENQNVGEVRPQVDKNQEEKMSTIVVSQPYSVSPHSLPRTGRKMPEDSSIETYLAEAEDSSGRPGSAETMEEEEMDLDVPEFYIDVVDEDEEECGDFLANGNDIRFAKSSEESDQAGGIDPHCIAESDKTKDRSSRSERNTGEGNSDVENDRDSVIAESKSAGEAYKFYRDDSANAITNAEEFEVCVIDSVEGSKEGKSNDDSCDVSIISEKSDAEAQNGKLHHLDLEETTPNNTTEATSIDEDSNLCSENQKIGNKSVSNTSDSSCPKSTKQFLSTDQVEIEVRNSVDAVTPEVNLSKNGTNVDSDRNYVDNAMQSHNDSRKFETVLAAKGSHEKTLPTEPCPIPSAKLSAVPLSDLMDRDLAKKQSISDTESDVPSEIKDTVLKTKSLIEETGSIDAEAEQIGQDLQGTETDLGPHVKLPSPHNVESPTLDKCTNKTETHSKVDKTTTVNKTGGKDGTLTTVANVQVMEETESATTTCTTTTTLHENTAAVKSIKSSDDEKSLAVVQIHPDKPPETITGLAVPAGEHSRPGMESLNTNKETNLIAGLADELVHNSSSDGPINLKPPSEIESSLSVLSGSDAYGNKIPTQKNVSLGEEITQSSNLSNKDSTSPKDKLSELPTQENDSRGLVYNTGRPDTNNIVKDVQQKCNISDKSNSTSGESANKVCDQEKLMSSAGGLSVKTVGNQLPASSDTENVGKPFTDEAFRKGPELPQECEPKSIGNETSQFDTYCAEKESEPQKPCSDDAEKTRGENSKINTPVSDSVGGGDGNRSGLEQPSNSMPVNEDLEKTSSDKTESNVCVNNESRPDPPPSCIDDENRNKECLNGEGSSLEKKSGQMEEKGDEKQSTQCTFDKTPRISNDSESVGDKDKPLSEKSIDEREEKFKDDLFDYISEICNSLIESATPDEGHKEVWENPGTEKDLSPTPEDGSNRSAEGTSSLEAGSDENNASSEEKTRVESKNSVEDVNLKDVGKPEASNKDASGDGVEDDGTAENGKDSDDHSQENPDSQDVEIIEELSNAKGIRVSSRSKEEDRLMVDAFLTSMTPEKQDNKESSSLKSDDKENSLSVDSDSKKDDEKVTDSNLTQEKAEVSSGSPSAEKEKEPSNTSDTQQQSNSSKKIEESCLTKTSDEKSEDELNKLDKEKTPKGKESEECVIEAVLEPDLEPSNKTNDCSKVETAGNNDKENEEDDEDDDITITSVEMAEPPAKKQKTLPDDITDIISSVYRDFPPRKTGPGSKSSTQGTSKHQGSTSSKNSTDVVFLQDSAKKPAIIQPVSMYRNCTYNKPQSQDSTKQGIGASGTFSQIPGRIGPGTTPGMSRNWRAEQVTSKRPFSLTGRVPRQQEVPTPKIITPRPYVPASHISSQQSAQNQNYAAWGTRQASFPSAASMIANNRNKHLSPSLSTPTNFTNRVPAHVNTNKTSSRSQNHRNSASSFRPLGPQVKPQNTFPPERTPYHQRPFNRGSVTPGNARRSNFPNPNRPVSSSSSNNMPVSRQGFPPQHGPPPRKIQKNLDGLKIVLDDNSDEEDSAPSRQSSVHGKRKSDQSVTPKIVSVCSLNKGIHSTAPQGSSQRKGLLPAVSTEPCDAEQIVLSDSD